jgi:hypothetical protein
MIAFSATEVVWSSVIDPTDFVPSEETGAGGGSVEGLRGTITTVEEVYGGFIIFSTQGVIAAVASDNISYPFTFSPLSGAGGVSSADYISSDSGAGSLYAYTTSGLQLISLRGAQLVFPDLTDFLSGSIFEDFNEDTNEFTITDTGGTPILKRISLISDRYLTISYGVSTTLTHTLLYDISMKRWGKLKLTHVDVFELAVQNITLFETQKKSIALLTDSGQVLVVNSESRNDSAAGVVLLGKYQYVRSRLLQLQQVELENIPSTSETSVYAIPSADGKTFGTPLEGYNSIIANQMRRYNFHSTATNFTVLVKGGFNLTSLILNFNAAGAR